MDLITVRELYKHPEEYLDKEINVGGWVRSLRDSKAFGFIVVSDGSFFETLQIDGVNVRFEKQLKSDDMESLIRKVIELDK